MNDNVNRPNHYVKIVNCKEYECKDTIKIITADSEASEAFFLGNSVKYLWRYKHKNGREDLQKAIKNIELFITYVCYEQYKYTKAHKHWLKHRYDK